MKNTSVVTQNLELFPEIDLDEANASDLLRKKQKADQLRLIRSNWKIAVLVNTGQLIKFMGKPQGKEQRKKAIELFSCFNEEMADLVLNTVKGASKGKRYIVPDYFSKYSATHVFHAEHAVSHWIRLVELRLKDLPFRHLINLFTSEQELKMKKILVSNQYLII